MHSKVVTVTLRVDADTMVSLIAKENILKIISDLPKEHQKIIIEICQNPKALQGLIQNKDMLLSMLS